MKCGYFGDEPNKNHTVALTDIVPDLLLQDIDAKFQLKKHNIIHEKDDFSIIGRGRYGKVYQGRCHRREVAIKEYLKRNQETFTDIRSEVTLLEQLLHPCIVCLVGVCVFPEMVLVLELAPLGPLSVAILKKNEPLHRLTIIF